MKDQKYKPLHNTDEHLFANMLKRFKIEHEVDVGEAGAEYKIEAGYLGFFALWTFNANGSFKETGAYE